MHFFGLSHDETLSIYQIETTDDEDASVEVSEAKKFGDVRALLGCEYVVDVVNHGSEGPVLVAGSHR